MFSTLIKPALWTLLATFLYAGLALAIFQAEKSSVDPTTTSSILQKN